MLDDSVLENIIEAVLEYVEVEVNCGCYTEAEPDFETIPYINDEDRLIVRKLIRKLLE